MNGANEFFEHLVSSLTGEQSGVAGSEPGGTSSPEERLTELPTEIATALRRTLDWCEQANQEQEQLAQELLEHYDQFNAAFEAGAALAACTSVPEALEVLNNVIALAIGSKFGYYFGQLADHSALSGGMDNEAKFVIYVSPETGGEAEAGRFLAMQEGALLECAGGETATAAMIDYDPTTDHDHAGRGNVLCVPLTKPGTSSSLGVLIFVRTRDQEPFVALDMNLAVSLAGTGSAVLNTILFAEKLQQSYLEIVASLVRAVEAKDSYTSGHSTRVAETACALGKAVGLEGDPLRHLLWAGMLHDIGKIGIRDEVLNKPGKLTDEEFSHIKSHPVQSYKVLEPVEALAPVLMAVRHHHEHFDGSGYPDGLSGEAIPQAARIIQVADVWDALTSTRSYRGAMPQEKARQIMLAEAGTTMDPELVQAFLAMLGQQEEAEAASDNV